MKKIDLVLAISNTLDNLNNGMNTTTKQLGDQFEPLDGLSNSQTDQAHVMHQRLIQHELITAINSATKKQFDASKAALDKHLATIGIDPNGKAGTTIELYNDGTLSFSKKQNKDGTSTLVVDLCTELARLGVEKSVVDEAIKRATKPKRGNVYYEINSA